VFEKEMTSHQIPVPPNKSIEFWPRSKVPQVIVCFEDDQATRSKPTEYDQVHDTLLDLPNKVNKTI
jgi:hypothetical protein